MMSLILAVDGFFGRWKFAIPQFISFKTPLCCDPESLHVLLPPALVRPVLSPRPAWMG